MSNKAADEMMRGVHRLKEQSAPVQFFGTLEIAWMRDCDLVKWQQGMGSGYFHKGKTKRHFITSLEQVQTFLIRRRAPPGWWGKPPDKRVLPPSGAASVSTRRAASTLAEGSASNKQKAGEAGKLERSRSRRESADGSGNDSRNRRRRETEEAAGKASAPVRRVSVVKEQVRHLYPLSRSSAGLSQRVSLSFVCVFHCHKHGASWPDACGTTIVRWNTGKQAGGSGGIAPPRAEVRERRWGGGG